VIVSNQIECLECGDRPFSSHRHDFKRCKCGSCAVDGGSSYLRRLGELSRIKELAIEVPDDIVKACEKEVQWGLDTGRNALGIAFATFRALRDTNVKMEFPE